VLLQVLHRLLPLRKQLVRHLVCQSGEEIRRGRAM
jgi:hypothetical protein